MADIKYRDYILRGKDEKRPVAAATRIKSAVLEGVNDWAGVEHRISWKYLSRPGMIVEKPHSHDFDEFLIFLGSNPASPYDFGGEIGISLGEEGEENIVNTTSVVCIPRGLIHGPLRVDKMIKPFLFAVIYMAPHYIRKPALVKTLPLAASSDLKYSKYILREPKGKEPRKLTTEEWGVCINEETLSGIGKFECNFNFLGIKGPHVLADPPHRHNCGEFLFLIPAGYENWPELGGEVEMAIGEDWEKQSIETAAVICLPKGLQHCPVNMKKVERPFYWGHVLQSPSYASSAYDPENPI